MEKLGIQLTYAIFASVLMIVMCRPRSVNKNNLQTTPATILNAEKLLPPDHVDAVKFEKDGHLNKDFHKEVFLGNHEEIDDDPIEIAEAKLLDIFHKYCNIYILDRDSFYVQIIQSQVMVLYQNNFYQLGIFLGVVYGGIYLPSLVRRLCRLVRSLCCLVT